MQTVHKLLSRLRQEAPGIIAGHGQHGGAAMSDGADKLASAISDIAGHYGRPLSAASLTAGMALVSGRLPLEHAELAAERAGLTCSIDKLEIASLRDHDLPAIILTAEGDVEIIWRISRSASGDAETATMSLPGRRDLFTDLPMADLVDAGAQRVIRLRPASGLDERGEAAMVAARKSWFLPAFRESRHIYAQAIGATIAINLLALAVPLFSMNVYDRVLPNAAEATLWALALGVMIAILFDFLIRTLRAIFVDTASRRADVRLSGLIYGRKRSWKIAALPAPID